MPNAINVSGGQNLLAVTPAIRNVQLIVDWGRTGPAGLSNATHLYIYQDSAGQPSTPTGGSWDGSNTLVPPTGWLIHPPSSITNNLWSCDVYVTGAVANITNWSQAGTYSGNGAGGSITVGAFTNINNVQFVGATVTNPASNTATVTINSTGTVNQVLGTSNDITVSPATSGASTYTVDLANAGTAGTYNFASITTDAKGRVTSATSNMAVTGLGASGQGLLAGDVTLMAGSNVTLSQSGSTITINAMGGGGGAIMASAKWTSANSTTKQAYSAPSVVNNDGITISLVASTGSGVPTNISVTLNGTTLGNVYSATGTFPNYTITIPVGDLGGNAIETATNVTVGITGTFSGSMFNATANNLNNTQPIPFNGSLTVSYAVASVPYYTSTANVTYSYSVTGSATTYAGTINGTSAPSASGTLNNLAISGLTIAGSVTGNGQYGAGASTINLSGSVPALSTFTPAFYTQTASSVVPTFTTSSSQTAGAEVTSTITYSVATASNQYVWLATTRPITSIRQVTQFGQATVVADVTSTQTIAGTNYNIFGFTNLSTTTAVQLTIIN